MCDTEGVTPRPWCQICVRACVCVGEPVKRREAAGLVSYVYISLSRRTYSLFCFTTRVLLFGVIAAGGTDAGSCMAGVS